MRICSMRFSSTYRYFNNNKLFVLVYLSQRSYMFKGQKDNVELCKVYSNAYSRSIQVYILALIEADGCCTVILFVLLYLAV
jgi:hypothetical protein